MRPIVGAPKFFDANDCLWSSLVQPRNLVNSISGQINHARGYRIPSSCDNSRWTRPFGRLSRARTRRTKRGKKNARERLRIVEQLDCGRDAIIRGIIRLLKQIEKIRKRNRGTGKRGERIIRLERKKRREDVKSRKGITISLVSRSECANGTTVNRQEKGERKKGGGSFFITAVHFVPS